MNYLEILNDVTCLYILYKEFIAFSDVKTFVILPSSLKG